MIIPPQSIPGHDDRASRRSAGHDEDSRLGLGAPGPAVPAASDAGAPRNANLADSVAPPRKGWFVWPVLIAAFVVDVAAFHNVMQLVLNTEEPRFVWAVVVGFSLLALWLAHEVGDRARIREEANRPALSSLTAWIIFAIWLTLGLFAVLVRLLVNAETTTVVGNQEVSTGGTGSPLLQALLFLTLYLATGAAAGFTAYRRPHPAIRQFHCARRQRLALVVHLAELDGRLARLKEMEAELDSLRQARERQREEAVARVGEAVSRLKQEADLLVAAARRAPGRVGRRPL